MKLKSYEFTARAKLGTTRVRPSLMSNWTVAGFALAVMVPLAMVFPKQALQQQVVQQRLGDALTVNYLSNLLKADPNNLELRILLAEHLIFLKEDAEVPQMLEPVLGSQESGWRTRGMLVEYKLLTGRYQRSAPGSSERRELKQRRLDTLASLHKLSWPLPTLVYLAGQADQLEEGAIARSLYRRISEVSLRVPASQLAAMAAREADDRNYELGSHLYFIAQRKANGLTQKRKYLLAGVRALVAGERVELAMHSIDLHAGSLLDDAETLYELIKLSRAANDQQRAIRYARRLLHLSQNTLPVTGWLARWDMRWVGIHSAEAATEQPPSAGTMRLYDSREYELAYQVFIENGKLQEAYRVAYAAVEQVPRELVWHQRLAQVAEWSGHYKVSLREWLWLSQHGGGRDVDLAIMRIAPGLNEYNALLDAWQRMARREKLTAEQWENIAYLFEQTGRYQQGIAFFEQRYSVDGLQQQLEIAARLAERSGKDARARKLYLRLIARHGANASWTMKAANLYLREGDYRKAYELLRGNQGLVDERDAAYWKAMADMAWQLQRERDAVENYRRLEQGGQLAREDYSRLIYLLADGRQSEKAVLAETSYLRFGDRDMLLYALEIYADKGDLPAQRRLFARAASDPRVNISDSARFYVLRGQYFQLNGELPQARNDFFHAVALAPHDSGTMNSLLWLLIDARDLQALRRMVRELETSGANANPLYWGALAAAHQVLGQPSRAVAYLSQQLKQGGQDYLWLVNYADVLEQAGHAGMAVRVRRHVWSQSRALLADLKSRPFSQEMLAAARLALMNASAEGGQKLVRAVLRQDRLLGRDEVATRESGDLELGWALSLNRRDEASEQRVNDLVLSWAASTEQSANAKSWLWRRYAQSLQRPQWAETSIILAENDPAQLATLLDGQGGGMTLLAKHDAAVATGRLSEAQSMIFEAMADSPDNPEIQRRLREDMLAAAGTVGGSLRDERLGNLHVRSWGLQIAQPLSPVLKMAAEYSRARQDSSDPVLMGILPSATRLLGVSVLHQGRWGATEVDLQSRQEVTTRTSARVRHELFILPDLQLRLGVESRMPASESAEFRVAGMRDEVHVGLRTSLGKRDSLLVESGWARYAMQTGSALGSGKRYNWEYMHKIWLEYPDLVVRVNGAHVSFTGTANGQLAMPQDANVFGVCTGLGSDLNAVYSHALRPYLDYCLTRNDASGQGYNAKLGVTGAVIGRDQFALSLWQERGGVNLFGAANYGLDMSYRYYF